VVVWSVALLVPMQGAMVWQFQGLDIELLLAKTLHVCAYGVLAGLSGWLDVPCRFRWLLVFFLAGHATATEFFQQFIEGRSGMIQDVGLDLIGSGLGCLATWRWWCNPA
jgi:VanZ family protein